MSAQINHALPPEKMAVVGAGLVGSLWALMLAQRGHHVDVFERRPDPRAGAYKGGRSINLALSDRGWRALEKAGIADEVRKIALPITHRTMHATDGTLTRQPYGLPEAQGKFDDPQCIYSVSRALLNRLLVEESEKHNQVQYRFDHKCTDIDLQANTLSIEDGQGQSQALKYDRIFGTDGAFSAVRDRLMRTDRFDFAQRYLTHGYKEIEMRPTSDGAFKMEADALHIWPRGEFMLMGLPNPDGTFTCTVFAPYDGPNGLNQLETPEAVHAYFTAHFPDVIPLIPDFAEQWLANPTSSLVMTQCYPWHHGDAICLMGDAAHAIVPFYGQGMNSGMEDCSVLSELLDAMESPSDWDATMKRYTELRKPSGDAILELALRNYIEMRDKTGDPSFLLRKKIEAKLATNYPGRWLPLYSQVTFSHTPYEEALQAGKRQDQIMEGILAQEGIATNWDRPEVFESILNAWESTGA
jgi:kynurenine 3-monooxygenase